MRGISGSCAKSEWVWGGVREVFSEEAALQLSMKDDMEPAGGTGEVVKVEAGARTRAWGGEELKYGQAECGGG